MKLPDWCAMPFALAWSVRNSTLISASQSRRVRPEEDVWCKTTTLSGWLVHATNEQRLSVSWNDRCNLRTAPEQTELRLGCLPQCPIGNRYSANQGQS